MKNKKGRVGAMAIKVDWAKGYHRVEWKLLYHILFLPGFNDKFIELITKCVSTPPFSLLLHGSPFFNFSLKNVVKGEGEGKLTGITVK